MEKIIAGIFFVTLTPKTEKDDTPMSKKFLLLTLWMSWMSCLLIARAFERQWTVADGLPTGEVHQMVELPTGQMLVNCEGVF